MKSFLTLVMVLGAAASAGAQGTKAPAKPDSSKTKAAATSAKAPATKQATPPATKAADTKQTATKQAPPATKAADTKQTDAKQAPAPAPGTKAGDTKLGAKAPGGVVPGTKQVESPTGTATTGVKTPTIMREIYAYEQEGRRDPFISLLSSSTLRPTVADLRLTGILYDENGPNSIAVMRDLVTNAQYRVIAGQTLGRMKVALIKRKVVIFSIEEFGLNRQDSLVLGDTTKVRAK